MHAPADPDPVPADWLSPPQVAREHHVGRDTVLDWIRSGELVAVNLADRSASRPRYRVSREALRDFLIRREVIPRVRKTRATRVGQQAKKYFS